VERAAKATLPRQIKQEQTSKGKHESRLDALPFYFITKSSAALCRCHFPLKLAAADVCTNTQFSHSRGGGGADGQILFSK